MNTPKKKNEFLYFALRNKKVLLGLSIILFFLVLAFIGPLINHNKPLDYVNPAGAATTLGKILVRNHIFWGGCFYPVRTLACRQRSWWDSSAEELAPYRDAGRFHRRLSRRHGG